MWMWYLQQIVIYFIYLFICLFKKSRFAWTVAARNRQVIMTFLLFAPASTKWLGWRKDRKFRRDRSGRFCDIYCAVILRYSFALRVISDILWSSCFESYGPKDTRYAEMRLWVAYNCVYKHLESLPDTSSQIFDWKPCQTVFLSLWPE